MNKFTSLKESFSGWLKLYSCTLYNIHVSISAVTLKGSLTAQTRPDVTANTLSGETSIKQVLRRRPGLRARRPVPQTYDDKAAAILDADRGYQDSMEEPEDLRLLCSVTCVVLKT